MSVQLSYAIHATNKIKPVRRTQGWSNGSLRVVIDRESYGWDDFRGLKSAQRKKTISVDNPSTVGLSRVSPPQSPNDSSEPARAADSTLSGTRDQETSEAAKPTRQVDQTNTAQHKIIAINDHTYPEIFEAITKVSLSYLEKHYQIQLPGGPISLPGGSCTEVDIALLRARFHCAVFDGVLDKFCSCCRLRTRAACQLRFQAIDQAVQLYQDFCVARRGTRPDHWAALIRAKGFLQRCRLSLSDLEAHITSSQSQTGRKPSTIQAPQTTSDNEELNQYTRTESYRLSKSSNATKGNPLASELSMHVSDMPITNSGFKLESEDKSKSIAGTCPSSGSKSHRSRLDSESDSLSSDTEDETSPELHVDENVQPITKQANVKQAESPRRRQKQKRQKPERREQHVNSESAATSPSSETTPELQTLLCSDQVTRVFCRVGDIATEHFHHSPAARKKIDEYSAESLSLQQCIRRFNDLKHCTPSWQRDFELRCLDMYNYEVKVEQKVREESVIGLGQMKQYSLHGLTNERVRLGLGKVSPKEHVDFHLAEADYLDRPERLAKLKIALTALFDHTLQQFWHLWHLVPEDRILLLDRLKSKLNRSGGRLPIQGINQVGQGFRVAFDNLQAAHMEEKATNRRDQISHWTSLADTGDGKIKVVESEDGLTLYNMAAYNRNLEGEHPAQETMSATDVCDESQGKP